MTVKTLSAVAVRIIGWLVILEGIRSTLSSLSLWMMRTMFTIIADSTRPPAIMAYLPIVTAIIFFYFSKPSDFSLSVTSALLPATFFA